MATGGKSAGVWDSAQCALLLIDYQDNTLGTVFEQDRRVIELNARTVAVAAAKLGIPVVLSTVGVGMGLNGPTIPSLQAVLPDAKAIDRTTTNAWRILRSWPRWRPPGVPGS
jgi:nicotinamidase-related amidase